MRDTGALVGRCFLEVQPPKIHRSAMKLQTQFPSATAFMPAPNQYRFTLIPIDEINQQQPLSYGESLWNHRQAPFRAGVNRVAIRAEGPAALVPLHGHRHPGIYAHTGAHDLHTRFKTGNVPKIHGRLLSLPAYQRPEQSAIPSSEVG
jgi:hypothetical protein